MAKIIIVIEKWTKLGTIRKVPNSFRPCFYEFTRLAFGISSAPAIFHRVMENLFKGIPGVCCYQDDILIMGNVTAEHLESLESVFKVIADLELNLTSASSWNLKLAISDTKLTVMDCIHRMTKSKLLLKLKLQEMLQS